MDKITTNRLAKKAVYFCTTAFITCGSGDFTLSLMKKNILKITFLGGGGGHAHAVVHMWQSEDNSQESAPLLYHVGHGDQMQVIRLGGKRLYLLNRIRICSLAVSSTVKTSHQKRQLIQTQDVYREVK